jgi:hypothetical protein
MCRVEFESEVFTLCQVSGFCQIKDAPSYPGVYLWCIEHGGAYLVNYVGKGDGRGGIAGRVSVEWRDFRNGRYWWPVRLDAFRGGCQIEASDSKEREVARQVQGLGPAFRIIVSKRIDGNCRRCENELVYRLRKDDTQSSFFTGRNGEGGDTTTLPKLRSPLLTSPVLLA